MPLDGDPSDVAGVFDQLEVIGRWATRFTIIDRKSTEGLAFAREQRTRPNGTDSIRRHAVAIVFPDGVRQDVDCIHGFLPINRCSARSTLRTHRHRPRLSAEAGKAGRSSAIEFLSVFVRKP